MGVSTMESNLRRESLLAAAWGGSGAGDGASGSEDWSAGMYSPSKKNRSRSLARLPEDDIKATD